MVLTCIIIPLSCVLPFQPSDPKQIKISVGDVSSVFSCTYLAFFPLFFLYLLPPIQCLHQSASRVLCCCPRLPQHRYCQMRDTPIPLNLRSKFGGQFTWYRCYLLGSSHVFYEVSLTQKSTSIFGSCIPVVENITV